MSDNNNDGKITQNFSNVTGSINAQNITGNNNTVNITQGNTNITIDKLSINDSQLERVESEYSESLKEFLVKINKIIKENRLESQKITEIQNDLNGFVSELKDATPTSGFSKKEDIRSKFIGLAKKSVKYLPKIAQVVMAFTPLAPLSPFIGEATKIVEEMQQES